MPTPQETLWTDVDHYLVDTLQLSDAVLDATMAANTAANLPAIDVSPTQGAMLHLFARMVKAKRILEIGTLGGFSTINMARALPEDGKLVTLEFEPLHAKVAAANIAHAGLAAIVEIRVGPALESLPKLIAESAEPFDLIFIDADKPNNPHYLEYALNLAHPGTLIVCDNIIREGEILAAQSTDDRVQGQRKLLEAMAANPRLTTTAIQTVGSKGYDGFAMAIVID